MFIRTPKEEKTVLNTFKLGVKLVFSDLWVCYDFDGSKSEVKVTWVVKVYSAFSTL